MLLYKERLKLEGGKLLEKGIKDRIFRRSALTEKEHTSPEMRRKDTNDRCKWKYAGQMTAFRLMAWKFSLQQEAN